MTRWHADVADITPGATGTVAETACERSVAGGLTWPQPANSAIPAAHAMMSADARIVVRARHDLTVRKATRKVASLTFLTGSDSALAGITCRL